MIPKALFLVLFGAALVLAKPIPGSDEALVPAKPESDVGSAVDVEATTDIDFDLFGDDDDDHTDISDATTEAARVEKGWKKLKNKWTKWVEKGKKKWNNLKADGKETYKKLKVKLNSKEAVEELKKIYNDIKDQWNDLKKTGKEAYNDVKQLISVAKKDLQSVKETWADVKKLG